MEEFKSFNRNLERTKYTHSNHTTIMWHREYRKPDPEMRFLLRDMFSLVDIAFQDYSEQKPDSIIVIDTLLTEEGFRNQGYMKKALSSFANRYDGSIIVSQLNLYFTEYTDEGFVIDISKIDSDTKTNIEILQKLGFSNVLDSYCDFDYSMVFIYKNKFAKDLLYNESISNFFISDRFRKSLEEAKEEFSYIN